MQAQFSVENSLLLLECCFCHCNPGFNFMSTSCITCYHVTPEAAIFHSLWLFLIYHDLHWGWLPWDFQYLFFHINFKYVGYVIPINYINYFLVLFSLILYSFEIVPSKKWNTSVTVLETLVNNELRWKKDIFISIQQTSLLILKCS